MKNTYITVIIFSLLIFLSGCSKEKTDEEMLAKDREALTESLNSQKVYMYKFGKICLRASVASNDVPEAEVFKSKFGNVSQLLLKQENQNNLSLLDYLSLYKNYRDINNLIETTDEDIFPPLTEALSMAYANDSVKKVSFQGNNKLYIQNLEHALLSVLVLFGQDFGTDIVLYECSKTNPDLLDENEIKGLLQFYRGFIFFQKQLYYLSEKEITDNINWLENNPNLDLKFTKNVFGWQNMNDKLAYTLFLSMNHLFRGLDRTMMKREIDEKRALEDFQFFIDNAKKVGMDNELLWSIEAFVYINKEENEKAVDSLSKLKNSVLLSKDEKKVIDETITYLQEREKGKWSNSLFDKMFMAKISSKYMFNTLEKVNWAKFCEENKVPYTQQIFGSVNSMKVFITTFDKYTSGETVIETGKQIQEKGKGLLDKAMKVME